MAAAEIHDIVIIGAGPAGLSLAAALRPLPLRVAVVERQAEAALVDPPYDGREIALTRQSLRIMREIGLFERIPESEVSPMRGARVYNGEQVASLDIDSPDSEQLGALVSNHEIRRAALAAARANERMTLHAGANVRAVGSDDARAWVELDDGRRLEAPLVVAADSRFSETRRAMGISARHVDYGKTMLVCRMALEVPHRQLAWEWFAHHQTLALLPLNGNRASIVLTLPHNEILRTQALPVEQFNRGMQDRFLGRLGRMTLEGERHAYPLVGVYPDRTVATRFATVGDASVGMHPVTAHGFNLGLLGQHTLSCMIAGAVRRGGDIGSPFLLRRYEFAHRRASLPLYLGTNAIVGLFTDESPPARLARSAVLGVARRFKPVGAGLARFLAQGAPRGLVR
jgi:ubiquinone biosynthesis UbiH/UbiF/VisC/COQ6 family hydroxylase